MTGTNLYFFLLGHVSAWVIITFYVYYVVRKSMKLRNQKVDEMSATIRDRLKAMQDASKDQHKMTASITEKLAKAHDITDRQLDLMGQLEQPQRSASHGKWKNDLRRQLQDLDKEKIEVLTSIVKDGFDPLITTLNDLGQSEKVKLSEFLTNQGVDLSEFTGKPQPAPQIPDQKKLKLTVVKGGKDNE